MAVRLDEETVRAAVDPELFTAAEALLTAGRVSEISPAGGGAGAVVRGADNDQSPYDVWVGVVDRALFSECDCPAAGSDEFCVHGLALALGALREDFPWSSAATAPSMVPVPAEVGRLLEIASTLPPRRLARLLAEHAATDRTLATRLLTAAGQLGEPAETELAEVCRTLDRLADEATAGRWSTEDVADAGHWMVEEVRLLALRPPNDAVLRVVEHAARLWDGLAGHLRTDDWERPATDPEEIGDDIRALHVQLCAEVEPDPDELAERLAEVIRIAEDTSCLGVPADYLPVLGPARVAALPAG